MENFLIPEVCMDIEEVPLDVGKDDTSVDSSSESNEPEIGDDEKVKLLLEDDFLNDAQVPEELTEFENEAKRNVFAVGEPAVQFQRLHCTACNVHLGSAPIGHFNRYIHPLLKVLLCKPCYDFYCSGEFDKDEDGSEMYCRWCGQGGKVMCCAQCAYVFCQKCVRQNLGKRTLELIKDSDDWLCFGCNSTQLINLKIICTSLYEFVREEIRLSKSLNNIERLKIDHSQCCQKVRAAKRKREDDIPYIPNNDWKEAKPRKFSVLKSTLSKPLTPDNVKATEWNKKEQAEVVCTPDLLTLMEDDPPPLTPAPKEMNKHAIVTSETHTKTQITAPAKPMLPEGKKLYTIAPKPVMLCNTKNLQKHPGNFIRFQAPTLKFLPSVNRLIPIVNSIPAQILPGTKHEWYDKAAAVISTITSNLSVTITNLTKEQKNAKSVEQLANVHNKLQELLSSSVNSLIQVRKNLRTEFLDDLNKLKFSNTYYKNNNRMPTKPSSISSSTNNTDDVNGDEDDDDVIVVTSESSSIKPLAEPPPLVKITSSVASKTRPYLKVRSVSQLLTVSSECITIPDDPPGSSTIDEDVIPVQDDPLDTCSDVPHQRSVNSNIKSEDEVPVMKDSTVFNEIDIINRNNALVEKRIQQLALENMELRISDISQEELKRVLLVRVLISTKFGETLPSNRLKNSYIPIIDPEVNLNQIEAYNESEENQCELTDTSPESNVADNLNDIQIEKRNTQQDNNKQDEALENRKSNVANNLNVIKSDKCNIQEDNQQTEGIENRESNVANTMNDIQIDKEHIQKDNNQLDEAVENREYNVANTMNDIQIDKEHIQKDNSQLDEAVENREYNVANNTNDIKSDKRNMQEDNQQAESIWNDLEFNIASTLDDIHKRNIQEDYNQQAEGIEKLVRKVEECTKRDSDRNTHIREDKNCIDESHKSLTNVEKAASQDDANSVESNSPSPNETDESQDSEHNVDLSPPCVSNASESSSNDPKCNVLSAEDCTINFDIGNGNNI